MIPSAHSVALLHVVVTWASAFPLACDPQAERIRRLHGEGSTTSLARVGGD